MPTVPVYIPKIAYVPTQTSLRLKNGNHPDAGVQTVMMQETNRILHYRTQEVCSFSQRLSAIESGSGVSWRCPYHSSTHVRYLWVVFRYAMIDAGGGTDMHVKVLVENAAGTDLGTATMRYSPMGAPALDTPNEFGTAIVPLVDASGDFVSPIANTDYFITISHENNGRLISCLIYEETLEATTTNGYLPSGVSVKGPILDVTRATMIPALRGAWKWNAGPLWHWAASDVAAPTNATATNKNVVDLTAPPVTTASAGVTLDLRHRSTERRAASGVPVIMKCYAKHSTGIGSAGSMQLLDASGALMGHCTTYGTTAAWVTSAPFFLPATEAKYQLYFSNNSVAGTMTAYAVSLLSYEA